MPRDVTLRLQDGYAKALRTPEVTRRLAEMGVDVNAGSPDELAKVMPLEIKKWGELVRISGAKAE
jgi:tripartite-type tricarboxylate transporter receptor subunit TctC